MEFVRQVINSDLLSQIVIPHNLKNTKVEVIILPVIEEAANTIKSGKLPRSTARGLLTGKVWMSDDFNEPLEELKEYME
ncbi:MAG: DUF2281 domain-containing protein [Oscillospiraceae bacterium]|nr:DUF2281 domain-containing protein [Oscillospiraceae bacterium]